MKFLIVCKNRQQGEIWLRNKVMFDLTFCSTYPNRNDIVIATSPEAVRGLQVTKGVFLPDWEEGTKDPIGFLQILYYASNGNKVIADMLNKVMK